MLCQVAGFAVLFRPRKKVMVLLTRIKGEDAHLATKLTKQKSLIKSHTDSIPRYKSHYSRADNPHHEYLTPNLTMTKLYSLYKEYCAEKGEHPISD